MCTWREEDGEKQIISDSLEEGGKVVAVLKNARGKISAFFFSSSSVVRVEWRKRTNARGGNNNDEL